MSVKEYWIGKGIDYAEVWHDYENGCADIDKFRSMRVHLIRIELDQFSADQPLFNHEARLQNPQRVFPRPKAHRPVAR
jgi:hypothetical protein